MAVIQTIRDEELVTRSEKMGSYLRRGLEDLQQKHEAIGDIRGEGLLLGVELVKDRHTREPNHNLGAATTELCFQYGLSMNIRRRPERGAVWRIAPPLTVTTEEIDRAITILDQALTDGQDQLAGKS